MPRSYIRNGSCELKLETSSHNLRSIRLLLATLIMTIVFYEFALPTEVNATVTASNAVTFYQNDNALDSVYAWQIASGDIPITLFESLNVKLTNPGFTFSYWTTNPDGSGVKYSDGALYNFDLGNINLYAQWTPNQVTFHENASLSDSVAALQSASTTTSLTLFSDLNPSFSNPGYLFSGWSTVAGGPGTDYSDGAIYDFTLGSISLYAQWNPATYSINYAADGGTTSATSATFTTGDSSLALPNATQTGYTFDGWFTSAQGGSLVGMSGASFTPTSSVTLYAQWTPVTSAVTYVGNGGTVPTAGASYTTGAPPLTLPMPTQTGYTFDGWFTSAQGGSLVGMSGAPFTPTSSVTLYAQWTVIPAFDVTFSANGGTGSVGSVSALSGASLSLPSPASISRPGYVFSGWNTVADGSGTAFDPSSTVILVGPMTLYAQWRQLPAAVVTFVLNGARGSINAISAYDGAIETLPTPPALARPGYVFTGWNTRANGTGSPFAGGVPVTLSASLNLYAQWSGHAPARLVSPIGPFTSSSVGVTGSLVSQVNRLVSLIIRQKRHVVTLYGYPSSAATGQAGLYQGRARVNSVALAIRRALAHVHHGGVRVVVVNEGLAAGTSNRVSVVVR